MFRKLGLASAAVAFLAGWGAPGALAVNYSSHATYSGTAATGGTVEFDVSGDTVSRFTTSEVRTTCGVLSGTIHPEAVPIVNEAFVYLGSIAWGVYVEGTFPAVQRAQGRLYSKKFPPEGFCRSEWVYWTAATSAPSRDLTAPQTKIESSPSGWTVAQKARFSFKSSEASSTFQCKLDKKAWKRCMSPQTYKNLKQGKHTFEVRARDKAGNIDPSPARRTWRVISRG